MQIEEPSIDMNPVEEMIRSEDAIFFYMNVDNEAVDLEEYIEEDGEYEENSEDDEELVQESEEEKGETGEGKSGDMIPFFKNIDVINEDVTSSWSLLQPTSEWTPSVELKKGLTFKDK
ncbi:unnamed protein product, partial [Cuscuta epithymum]